MRLKMNTIYAGLFAGVCTLAFMMGSGPVRVTAKEKKPDPKLTGHEQLQFEGMFKADAGNTTTTQKSTQPRIKYMRERIPAFTIPAYKGQRYEQMVPDTLDLA